MPRKKQKGKGLYDKVANKLFNANMDKDAIHAPQWTKKGIRFAQYTGPGTDVYGSIRKGKKPLNKSDTVAQLHDLNYDRAKNSADVRAADLRMVKKLKQIRKTGGDYKINTLIGELPIRAKMKLEDWGIMKKGSFSDMKGVDKNNATLNKSEVDRLTQAGYGKKKKNPWIDHVRATRAKHKGLSYKDALKKASKTYNK